MLSSKAAITCLVMVLILAPITGVMLFARAHETSSFFRMMYTIGLGAPAAGILVAILSLIRVVARGRKVRLSIGEQISIPASGIQFGIAQLRAVQLFSCAHRSFMALIPAHVDERLSVRSVESGAHSLDAYIVEFPAGAVLPTFEVADRIQAFLPTVRIEKIGTVRKVARR